MFTLLIYLRNDNDDAIIKMLGGKNIDTNRIKTISAMLSKSKAGFQIPFLTDYRIRVSMLDLRPHALAR